MSIQAERKSKRLKPEGLQQIDVKVRRYVNAESPKEPITVEAKIVEFSANGFKLESSLPFEFLEKVTLEIHCPKTKEWIPVSAQVRWVHPNREDSTWAAGCILTEGFPSGFVDAIAQTGVLNRRRSPRYEIEKSGLAQWELSQEEIPATLLDVSTGGMRIRLPKAGVIGKRLRIKYGDGPENQKSLMAKAVWQSETPEGFLIGCEIIEGSPTDLIREKQIVFASLREEHRHRSYGAFTLGGLTLALILLIRHLFF